MKSLTALLFLSFLAASAAAESSVVERWFSATSSAKSVEVEFTQKRKLKTIKLPIKSQGKLWIDYADDRFRWETGNPPQTVVLRVGKELTIIRTPGKRFEKRDVNAQTDSEERKKPKSGMSILAGGFPRTLEAFRAQYRVLETTLDGPVHRVSTKPLDARGQSVESFVFLIDAETYFLRGFDIRLVDKSTIEMSFDEVRPNVKLRDGLFSHDLTGYKETEF
ncbi:MAG: outer membrane lipoprotein carrier protein LolA [Verrucomicrobiota bacterium]